MEHKIHSKLTALASGFGCTTSENFEVCNAFFMSLP